MKNPAQPLAEVFGHLITDHTERENGTASPPFLSI
jgi:hypothetical protein